jgi:hypothetical protein
MKKLKPGQLFTYNNTVYQVRRSKNGIGCDVCDYWKNILNEPRPCLKCARVPDNCYLEDVSQKHIYVLHPENRCREITVKLNHPSFLLLLQIRNLCKRNFTCSFRTVLKSMKFAVEGTNVKRRLSHAYLVEFMKQLSEEYEKLNIK